MNKKRIVITGGSGLLGLNWACAIRNDWDVVLGTHQHSVHLSGTTQSQLDLSNLSKLDSQIELLSPDLIVHTAGLTSIEHCEGNPELASQVNAQIAKNVAVVSERKKIKFIHISTDHLFSGDSSFYKEESTPNPLNEYAKSKLLGELWVQEVNPEALILRTNFFCWGYKQRQSFSDWIIFSLREGKFLKMFDDVFFTPILADTLAHSVHKLINKNVSGIYNLVGDERISKYEFAIKLAEYFKLPIKHILRSKIRNENLLTQRPVDMSLNNHKVSQELGFAMGGLDDYFRCLHEQEIKGRAKELYNVVV